MFDFVAIAKIPLRLIENRGIIIAVFVLSRLWWSVQISVSYAVPDVAALGTAFLFIGNNCACSCVVIAYCLPMIIHITELLGIENPIAICLFIANKKKTEDIAPSVFSLLTIRFFLIVYFIGGFAVKAVLIAQTIIHTAEK